MSFQIAGMLMKYTWRNEKSGASYMTLLTDEELPDELCSSKIMNGEKVWHYINVDATRISVTRYPKFFPLVVNGDFEQTRREGFARSFIASSIEESCRNEDIAYKYLTSADVGLSVSVAKNLISGFGADIFSYGSKVNEYLKALNISKSTVDKMQEKLHIYSETRKVSEVLSTAEIPFNVAAKIVSVYKLKSLEKITNKIYNIAERFNINFIQADTIAKRRSPQGLETMRMRLANNEAHKRLESQGHTLHTYREYLKSLNRTINPDGKYESNGALALAALSQEARDTEKKDVYRFSLHETEERIKTDLSRLSRKTPVYGYNNALIKAAESFCGIKYGKSQTECFKTILGTTGGIKLLIGGPGTGKTTTIKGILFAYNKLHPEHVIKLCAPTGRAAQRMSEQTEMEAVTIHRLLEYVPYVDDGGEHCKDESDQLGADLLVVDEMSMTDTDLFGKLLRAVKTGATIILVGDTNQLEPVGPGAVLRDILSAQEISIEKCYLSEVFRQGKDSPIVSNAYSVNEGKHNLFITDDFKVIRTKSEEESYKVIVELEGALHDPDSPFKTQLLCPVRKGMAGITAMNEALQNSLNERKDKYVQFGNTRYYVGDKVMMTNNNYDENCPYFNGDIGIIKSIQDKTITIDIRNTLVEIPKEQMDEMTLAYGMTVHKSQGSEFENVILYLPIGTKSMLLRNLTYTAITRAKKKIWIVDENGALDYSINNETKSKRRTYLSQIL